MNMQMRLFSCRTTGCKDLSYHIRNDITTCNNEDFDVGLFYDFPSCFKDSITIHEYAKKYNLHNLPRDKRCVSKI